MNKKYALYFSIGIVVLAFILVVGFLLQSNKAIPPAQIVESEPVVTPEIPLTTYTSESGFTFSYPENLSFYDTTNEKNQYAKIVMTSEDMEGSLTITVEDTTVQSAFEWFEREGIATESATISTHRLGDIMVYQLPTEAGVSGVAYDQGALFIFKIDAVDTESKWQNILNTVYETFAFVLPEGVETDNINDSGSDTSTGIIFEGEEIIP